TVHGRTNHTTLRWLSPDRVHNAAGIVDVRLAHGVDETERAQRASHESTLRAYAFDTSECLPHLKTEHRPDVVGQRPHDLRRYGKGEVLLLTYEWPAEIRQ